MFSHRVRNHAAFISTQYFCRKGPNSSLNTLRVKSNYVNQIPTSAWMFCETYKKKQVDTLSVRSAKSQRTHPKNTCTRIFRIFRIALEWGKYRLGIPCTDPAANHCPARSAVRPCRQAAWPRAGTGSTDPLKTHTHIDKHRATGHVVNPLESVLSLIHSTYQHGTIIRFLWVVSVNETLSSGCVTFFSQ
jgi:hypothetical protein